MSAPVNLHATSLVVGTRGLAIFGSSGSGKTTLALHLIGAARVHGRYAALVSDDRTWFARSHGRLVMRAPAAIAGLVELRGYGPAPAPHLDAAVLDLALRLVPAGNAPRVADEALLDVLGLPVPLLELPERACLGNAAAVSAALEAG